MTTHHIDLVIGMGLFVLGVLFFLIGCGQSSPDKQIPQHAPPNDEHNHRNGDDRAPH